jgi:hypothetical protein
MTKTTRKRSTSRALAKWRQLATAPLENINQSSPAYTQATLGRIERPSNMTEATMNLITLSHGPALQAIWARDSYAITAARLTFARAHGIAPDDVVVTMEYAAETFQQAPTADELVIINAV